MPRPKVVRRGREFWAKLVDEFERGGAAELHQAFADRHGVECDTFRRWLYLLRAERRGRRWRTPGGRRRRPSPPMALSLIQVASGPTADGRFEIELRQGRRVRVPASFDGEALRRLLAIFDETSAS
jgi:hypothetical protein